MVTTLVGKKQDVSGESKPITPEILIGCEKHLFRLFSLYQQLKDICNTDKFELFYESFPNKTYYLKSDKCSVGKLSKIAITGLVVANVKTWNEK